MNERSPRSAARPRALPSAAPRAGRPRKPAADADTLDQAVYEALFDDLMHGRLKPGAKLVESTLCAQFDVSRTVVRQALRRLAEQHIVEVVPNRGAMVAAPGPEETRQVFAARRVIEAGIVREVAARITHADVLRLQQRMRAEHDALSGHDHSRWVALAGGFHLALAQLAGNAVLLRMLTELMTRCSLIVALYEPPGDAGCEHDEHEQIVELLSLRDAQGATAVMERHLLELESRLRLPPG